jgi:hypothetical protein
MILPVLKYTHWLAGVPVSLVSNHLLTYSNGVFGQTSIRGRSRETTAATSTTRKKIEEVV